MASPIPQYRIWNEAKGLARKLQFDEAVALYRNVEADMLDLPNWRAQRTERDNAFDMALFFGDYCGALADAGQYAKAEEKANIALGLMEQQNFKTLKYIYYNIGNIFLFQKEYEKACPWFEKALAGANYYYTIIDYLINYGIALYFLGQTDKAAEIFQLTIKDGKGTKYDKSFGQYFYMMKICEAQDNPKEAQKYRKMYLTRLKKYTLREVEVATATEEYKEEIVADYETVTK